MIAQIKWNHPPMKLTLPENQIHIWRVPLDPSARTVADFQNTLAPDELARAARFRFAQDRDHFLIARARLRAILSRYTNIQPRELVFQYSAKGKPRLANAPACDALSFNVSHSQGLALCAIARGSAVGIDLERVRANSAWREIAQRFFSPQETAMLDALPLAEQSRAFFECWTRREAYLKATGDGIASLDAENFGDASHWSLRSFTPCSGYVAALAVKGATARLEFLQWFDHPRKDSHGL